MRYYLIAGEASGDLHASHLMRELREQDPQADFRCIGGDMMQAQGGSLLRHYRQIAFMGFIPVITHLGTILGAMRQCRDDIVAYRPDCVILVDYSGFNLRIARWLKGHTAIPVTYYILPKVWAWDEKRVSKLRRDCDHLLSILPFEVRWFRERHGVHVDYVGNPTADEVRAFSLSHPADADAFRRSHNLAAGRPIIALLPGSRRQEISRNLPVMLEAARPYARDYQLVVAGAPGMERDFYSRYATGAPIVYGDTYALLQSATAALVTSGTATLETALMRVPQVVCYAMRGGRLTNWAKRHLLRVPYISLVNLIADAPVVAELVAAEMTPSRVREQLALVLPDGKGRRPMLEAYDLVCERLGSQSAPLQAASLITGWCSRCRA